MDKKSFKTLTGVFLSVAAFISLLIPIWSVDKIRTSGYNVVTKSEAYSPFMIMTGEGLASDYEWVAGLASVVVIMMLIAAIANLTSVLKNKNKYVELKSATAPGVFLVVGSFIFMVIGFVAVTTYGTYDVPVATGYIGFSMVTGAFSLYVYFIKQSNSEIGSNNPKPAVTTTVNMKPVYTSPYQTTNSTVKPTYTSPYQQTPAKPTQPTTSQVSSSTATNTINNAATEELLNLKQLLDLGAITQEEYDAKKKEILGL